MIRTSILEGIPERFVIRKSLGSGGMGTVYEAMDQHSGSLVALKVLRRRDPESLFRFKREFRALADVRHPNLVRLGELHATEHGLFFTMELVRGENFLQWIRTDSNGLDFTPPVELDEGADLDTQTEVVDRFMMLPDSKIIIDPQSGSSFDENRLYSGVRQLAEALQCVHDTGRLHRDLKPTNVLVADEGRVVLMDFGLVWDEDVKNDGLTQLLGTPAYMAPEQALGASLTPKADWYAFGVVLFRALTGTLPFSGSLRQIVRDKCVKDGPAPSAFAPGIPPALDELARSLLRRDPAERASAVDVFRCLDGRSPRTVDAATLADSAPARELFIGRGAELAGLARAFDEARSEGTVSVLIRGEPGIGKSQLVSEFLARVGGPGCLILRGRCYEQESLPFRAFDAVVDALTLHLINLKPEELAPLLVEDIDVLGILFPVLKRIPEIAHRRSTKTSPTQPEERRLRGFGAFASLLSRLARQLRLIIAIDDLQWADDDSLDLIEHLLHAASRTSLLLVATARDGDIALEQRTALVRGMRTIPLARLTDEQSRTLARLHGVEPSCEYLEEAAGHPLFLTELIKAARGTQRPERGESLDAMIGRRLDELGSANRRFAEICCIAGAPVDLGAVVHTLDDPDPLDAVHALVNAQLIKITRKDERRLLEPYHDRIREAVLATFERNTSEHQRQETHLRLGRALLSTLNPTDLEREIFTVVRHLNKAKELFVDRQERSKVAELNLRAARRALMTTAVGSALEHARAGSSLLDREDWIHSYQLARDLAILEMEAAFMSRQGELGSSLFSELRNRLRTARERTDLYARKIDLNTAFNQHQQAVASALEGLAALGEKIPRRPTRATLLREYIEVRRLEGRTSLETLAQMPMMESPVIRDIMKLLAALMMPAHLSETKELFNLVVLRITKLSLRHGICDVSPHGFVAHAMALSSRLERYHEADRIGRLALQLNARIDNEELWPRLYFLNGMAIRPWVRPFAESAELLDQAYASAIELGQGAYETYSRTTRLVQSWVTGRSIQEIRERADVAVTSRTIHGTLSRACRVISWGLRCGADGVSRAG